MKAVLKGLLWLLPENKKDHQDIQEICYVSTYKNPLFESAQKYGSTTKGIAPMLKFYEQDGDWYGFARAVCANRGIKISPTSFKDSRSPGRRVDFADGALPWVARKGQKKAVHEMTHALIASGLEGGVLEAPCGSGKTIMAIQLIKAAGVSTAILVDNEFLLKQWKEVLGEWFPKAKIGVTRQAQVCSGEDHDLVLCMIPSLIGSREYPDSFFKSFGLLIYDECHHGSAEKFSEVFSKFYAKYRLGLTATPDRKDGLMDVYLSHIGPIAHTFEVPRILPALYIRKVNDVPDKDDYATRSGKDSMPLLVNALSSLESRNLRIIKDIVDAAKSGRKCLVLTGRRAHVELLTDALKAKGLDASSFMGGMKEDAQEKALKSQIVVGTFKMAQEGLDAPTLDTLFLTTPKSDIRQAVGRIQREHPNKKHPIIVDYLDSGIGLCTGLFFARKKHYWALGITENK